MSGILNNKERILDLVVTQEGRRQISSGKLVVNYASFSDYQTFYQKDNTTGITDDASNRIFFETNGAYQDVIVPEIQVGNEIRPFKTKDFDVLGNGTIASGTFKKGFQDSKVLLGGGYLDEINNNFFDNITQNFLDLRVLATKDVFSDTTDFTLLESVGKFSIVSDNDFNKIKTNNGTISAENMPSLFESEYFSHLPNFKYLPPVNTLGSEETVAQPLGDYNFQKIKIESFFDVQKALQDKQKIEVKFSDTSRQNNLCLQVFECFDDNNGTKIEKLSSVDFGEFSYIQTQKDNKNIYFIGKIVRDGNGSDTYFNIFTIVAE